LAAKKSKQGSQGNGQAKGQGHGAGGSGVPAWLSVLVALVIAVVAAFALLTLGGGPQTETPPRLADEPESPTQHDRDQIDQESRDQLRDILRAADNGS